MTVVYGFRQIQTLMRFWKKQLLMVDNSNIKTHAEHFMESLAGITEKVIYNLMEKDLSVYSVLFYKTA